MTPIIGTDISYYESPVYFPKMRDAGAKFVIHKVGQADLIDRDFRQHWYQCKNTNIPQGGYWFYDKKSTPLDQAQLFIESMEGDYGELPLFADFEGTVFGGGEIANFKIFIERVQALVPNKEIIIYTNYYFWKDDSGYNASYASFFKQFGLWIAAYKTFAPKIPAPWSDWEFWQYDDKGSGSIWGTEGGAVDLNYFNGDLKEFHARFNIPTVSTPLPTDDEVLYFHDYNNGVKYHKYRSRKYSQGATVYHVLEMDNSRVSYFVSSQIASRKYVPDFLAPYNLDFAINLDGWTSPPLMPTGYNASEGKPYGKKGNTENIWISSGNSFDRSQVGVLWNALSFQNRLVVDGAIVKVNKPLDDIRGRSAFGFTKDQRKCFIVAVDGADYFSTKGMNFPQTAQIFIDLGCDFAVMFDSGGSTTLASLENGKPVLLNVPSGEDTVEGYVYPMRRVVNVLGVRATDGTPTLPTDPPTGGTMLFEIIKSARYRSEPTITTNDSGASSVVGQKFTSNVTQIDSHDPSIIMVLCPNGMWLPLKIKLVEYTRDVTPAGDPPSEPTVTHVIKTTSVGGLIIDGKPYVV